MRDVVALPGGWALRRDEEARPFLFHEDGRELDPKTFAGEGDSREVYTALKMEEDRIARIHPAVDHDPDWLAIWKARVTIGIIFAERISGEAGDKLFHEETERAVRRMQRDRVRYWGG